MRLARVAGGVLWAIGLGMSATGTGAVENDPLPVPKGGARERAVTAYNEGVKLMVDKRYAAAQQKFEQAVWGIFPVPALTTPSSWSWTGSWRPSSNGSLRAGDATTPTD